MDGAAFLAYLEKVLVATLREGDSVVMGETVLGSD